MDPTLYDRARLEAYLLRWSLVDPDGQPVEVSVAAIDQLFGDDFAELVAAIDAHTAAVEAAREAEKKTRIAGASSPVIS